MKHRVEEKSRVQLENSLMKMMCPWHVSGGSVGAWHTDTQLQPSSKKACLHFACCHNFSAWHLPRLEVTDTALAYCITLQKEEDFA